MTGTRGHEESVQFVADQFAAIGLEPGGTDGWFQQVPLITRMLDTPGTIKGPWTGSGLLYRSCLRWGASYCSGQVPRYQKELNRRAFQFHSVKWQKNYGPLGEANYKRHRVAILRKIVHNRVVSSVEMSTFSMRHFGMMRQSPT